MTCSGTPASSSLGRRAIGACFGSSRSDKRAGQRNVGRFISFAGNVDLTPFTAQGVGRSKDKPDLCDAGVEAVVASEDVRLAVAVLERQLVVPAPIVFPVSAEPVAADDLLPLGCYAERGGRVAFEYLVLFHEARLEIELSGRRPPRAHGPALGDDVARTDVDDG